MSWFVTIIIFSFTFNNFSQARNLKKLTTAVVVKDEYSKKGHFISDSSLKAKIVQKDALGGTGIPFIPSPPTCFGLPCPPNPFQPPPSIFPPIPNPFQPPSPPSIFPPIPIPFQPPPPASIFPPFIFPPLVPGLIPSPPPPPPPVFPIPFPPFPPFPFPPIPGFPGFPPPPRKATKASP